MRSVLPIGFSLLSLVLVGAWLLPGCGSEADETVVEPSQIAEPVIDVDIDGDVDVDGNIDGDVDIDIDNGDYSKLNIHEELDAFTLLPKEKFLKVVPLWPEPAQAIYVYRVGARTLDSDAANLRIQAAWLAEGGWDAKDAAGESLAQIKIKTVEPDAGAPDTFDLVLTRPSSAAELRIFLYNEGETPIEVTKVLVIEATPSHAEKRAG